MTYSTVTDFPASESRLRDVLSRTALRIGGALALAASALLVTSLATWHVDDPSFSYASDLPASNWLGEPGAAFADIGMQFLGLAVVGFVFPLVMLGWNLLRLKRPRRPVRQLFAWLGGAVLLAGALSCLPVLGGWPLPTGLGGATGDLILQLPEWVLGGPLAGGSYAALCVILGGLGLGLLWFACLARPTAPAAGVTARPAKRKRQKQAEMDEESDDEGAGGGRLALAAGVLAHWALTGQAMVRRGLARRASSQSRVREPAPSAAPRREPRFAAPPPSDDFDDADEPDFDTAFADDFTPPALAPRTVPQAIAPPSNAVVQAPAPRPKPVIRAAHAPVAASAGGFELPPIALLSEPPPRRRDPSIDKGALEQNARLLEGVLEDFGVRGEIINVRPGPVVTLYELEPAPGIKSSRVISLADDIARSMSAIAARVAVIPGKNAIGIELPNALRETVYLRELLGSTISTLQGQARPDAGQDDRRRSRRRRPRQDAASAGRRHHRLRQVGGHQHDDPRPGLPAHAEQCRLIMIDPKMLELSVYDGIPHLLTPVVTDPKKAVVALKWTVREMEDRYKKMSKLGVRNIDGFNQRIARPRQEGEQLTRTVQTGSTTRPASRSSRPRSSTSSRCPTSSSSSTRWPT
jgi:S-DNA-T family DNA segregation ATPase FtsK/SpoIIIE